MIYNKQAAVKIAKFLLSINAMSFRFNPPYTYTTGMLSPMYLDNRLVMSYPKVRDEIIKTYIAVLKEKVGMRNVDVISATATAAIPQGAWIADRTKLPMVFVRPSTKMHGKGSKVEGYFKKGSNVVIIEDHISTAASVAGNAQSIRELGGKVKYVIATTTYDTELSQKTLKENKVKLFALTTGEIIIETAYKMGKISKKEKESIENWLENPQNWQNSS